MAAETSNLCVLDLGVRTYLRQLFELRNHGVRQPSMARLRVGFETLETSAQRRVVRLPFGVAADTALTPRSRTTSAAPCRIVWRHPFQQAGTGIWPSRCTLSTKVTTQAQCAGAKRVEEEHDAAYRVPN